MKDRITVIGHYGMSLLMDVKKFPAVGETVEGLHVETEPGGKGYNQAIAASRLGADVHFITAAGGDDFGKRCEEDLISEKVNGRHIIHFPELMTAVAFVINTQQGESEVYVYPGAIRSVTAEHIRTYSDVIRESSLLLIQNEINTEALCEAVRIGREAGIRIIYNPAPARDVPKELFSMVDVITPNETEAAILAGLDPDKPFDVVEVLHKLEASGTPDIIITCGEKGSYISHEGRIFHIPPYRGVVVSTTGAGDCYNAALAVRYIRTGDLLEAARYASVSAGLQVQRPGVIANLPVLSEVDEAFGNWTEKAIEVTDQ